MQYKAHVWTDYETQAKSVWITDGDRRLVNISIDEADAILDGSIAYDEESNTYRFDADLGEDRSLPAFESIGQAEYLAAQLRRALDIERGLWPPPPVENDEDED